MRARAPDSVSWPDLVVLAYLLATATVVASWYHAGVAQVYLLVVLASLGPPYARMISSPY
jgi:hypothetical protein